MSRPVDLPAAAHRHHRCAQLLERPEPAEAGYLYGLAAECAVKAIAEDIPCLRRDDVFYAHFPELKDLVIDHARGRGTERLVRLMESDRGYMGGWRVGMRYEGARSVANELVANWKDDARAAIGHMERA